MRVDGGWSWGSAPTGRDGAPPRAATPGPGAYDSVPAGGERGAAESVGTFGTAVKPAAAPLPPTAAPGPGAYDGAESMGQPATHQRGAVIAPPPSPRPRKAASPGPGHYDADGAPAPKPPVCVVGTAPRAPRPPRAARRAEPGPGHYDPAAPPPGEGRQGYTFPTDGARPAAAGAALPSTLHLS
eukprot:gene44362-2871_t